MDERGRVHGGGIWEEEKGRTAGHQGQEGEESGGGAQACPSLDGRAHALEQCDNMARGVFLEQLFVANECIEHAHVSKASDLCRTRVARTALQTGSSFKNSDAQNTTQSYENRNTRLTTLSNYQNAIQGKTSSDKKHVI